MKIYNKREKISPKTDFYKNENTRDGHLNDCKIRSKIIQLETKRKLKIIKNNIFKKTRIKLMNITKNIKGIKLKQMLFFV